VFYLLALAGLVIGSVVFTGRIEPPVEALPPAPTTPTFPKAGSTLTLPEADQKACPIAAQKTAFYRVETSRPVDQRLVISGVVYASDFVTPVPDVLIEVWQAPESYSSFPPYFPAPPHYLFRAWARTDAAGRYQATILKSSLDDIFPLYYRVRYQNRCPLGVQLVLVDEATGLANGALAAALAKLGLAQGEPAGPLLRGSIDIVLPHLYTPLPEAARLVGTAPPQGMTWDPSYDAAVTNLEPERDRPELEVTKRNDLNALSDAAEGSGHRQ
jgi:hypothetical protein